MHSPAKADGFRNPFQSAAAISQGNAFAAQAGDASAGFYNPAAMTQLRRIHHLGSVEFVNVDTHFATSMARQPKTTWVVFLASRRPYRCSLRQANAI
jgi:hypothetical protein